MAEEWISKRQGLFDDGKSVQFAITDKESGFLIGGIGFDIHKEDENAELGYWIGHSYWHKGCCSEAATAIVKYIFETLELNRICGGIHDS